MSVKAAHTTLCYARMTFVMKTISEELSYCLLLLVSWLRRKEIIILNVRQAAAKNVPTSKNIDKTKPEVSSSSKAYVEVGEFESHLSTMLIEEKCYCWLHQLSILERKLILRFHSSLGRHVRWFSMSLMGFAVMLFVHFSLYPFVFFVALFSFLRFAALRLACAAKIV